MNTRCPPKRVLSAARFFTHCELTVQPPQSYSVGGQRSPGQLAGKPAGARPDYRGRWCAFGICNYFKDPAMKSSCCVLVPNHWVALQINSEWSSCSQTMCSTAKV
ncbi:UNVERIFIED_CONTAM: hypothetical protein FKN15_002545 [Acipenser sinensis]